VGGIAFGTLTFSLLKIDYLSLFFILVCSTLYPLPDVLWSLTPPACGMLSDGEGIFIAGGVQAMELPRGPAGFTRWRSSVGRAADL
jgi:hypothetical protein